MILMLLYGVSSTLMLTSRSRLLTSSTGNSYKILNLSATTWSGRAAFAMCIQAHGCNPHKELSDSANPSRPDGAGYAFIQRNPPKVLHGPRACAISAEYPEEFMLRLTTTFPPISTSPWYIRGGCSAEASCCPSQDIPALNAPPRILFRPLPAQASSAARPRTPSSRRR